MPMKLVIFLPLLVILIPMFLLVFGFFFLIVKLVVKAKQDAWTGTVLEKVHNTKRIEHNRFEHFYYLVVGIDGAGERKIGLSAQMYEDFQKGDRIEKVKGDVYPKKITGKE